MPGHLSKESSLVGFNDFISWSSFFQDLEKLVIKNLRKDTKVNPNDSITRYLSVFSNENSDEKLKLKTAEDFCQTNNKIISDMLRDLKDKIGLLNEELKPFWL
mmetsp:Transcript_28869/g.43595  ORF Transcript_28869/g.43595 Transcript_28869/m.43595 type:complete len:103 (+) Transcript_28869:781-1089(+)